MSIDLSFSSDDAQEFYGDEAKVCMDAFRIGSIDFDRNSTAFISTVCRFCLDINSFSQYTGMCANKQWMFGICQLK